MFGFETWSLALSQEHSLSVQEQGAENYVWA